MLKKLSLIVVFLLIASMSFVSSRSCYDYAGLISPASCYEPATSITTPATSLQSETAISETTGATASGGDSIIITSENSNYNKDETECGENKGCFLHNKCYPYGYMKDGKYCSDKDPFYYKNYKVEIPGFVNQTETGKFCKDNFECETNLCQNGLCINITEQVNNQVNTKLNEIKSNIVSDVEEGINQLNDSEKYYVEVDNHNVAVDKTMLKKFLDWFKNVLR